MSEPTLSEDLLSALVDGELDPAIRADVEVRLASDPEWQAVLAEIADTRAAIRGLGAVEVPDGWLDRVLASGQVVDLDARRASRRSGRRLAALTGVAAAAFVVGVVAVPSREPERVRPPVAAFSDAHATRSSVGDDAISSIASVGLSRFGR